MFIFLSVISTLTFGYVVFKSKSKFYEIDKIAAYICQNFPTKPFGDKLKISNETRKFSALDDNTPLVMNIIKKNCKYYLILWISFTVLASTLSVISLKAENKITYLIRPEAGIKYNEVSLRAETQIGKNIVEKVVSIKVNPKIISKEMQIENLNKFIKSIPNIILNQNKNLAEVSTPLNLINYDKSTGIQIEWDSNNKNLLDNNGFVYSINLIEPKEVELLGTFRLMDTQQEIVFKVIVINNDDSAYINKVFTRNIQAISKHINASTGNDYMFLPEQDNFGNDLLWSKGNENLQSNFLLMFSLCLIVIYFNRYKYLFGKSKRFKNDIIRDLPSFVTKFILLLNAGMVVSSALEKIAFDYERNIRKQGITPIYEELLIIEYKIVKTKTSLLTELKNLGERTKIREISRFAAIISENINKGSELVDKLEIEGELLWSNRKKRIEERARLTEAKLTLPLLILLLVLILLTISPVLITFN
jgi:hypothetical protein